MAWTRHFVAGQFAGGQGPAVMGADVVEGVVHPFDVEQSDQVAIDLDHGRPRIGKFTHRGHPYEITHR